MYKVGQLVCTKTNSSLRVVCSVHATAETRYVVARKANNTLYRHTMSEASALLPTIQCK